MSPFGCPAKQMSKVHCDANDVPIKPIKIEAVSVRTLANSPPSEHLPTAPELAAAAEARAYAARALAASVLADPGASAEEKAAAAASLAAASEASSADGSHEPAAEPLVEGP